MDGRMERRTDGQRENSIPPHKHSGKPFAKVHNSRTILEKIVQTLIR